MDLVWFERNRVVHGAARSQIPDLLRVIVTPLFNILPPELPASLGALLAGSPLLMGPLKST